MNLASGLVELLRVALDEFDLPSTAVSASARRAVRIAALRRDYANQLWLQWELTDATAGKHTHWQDPAITAIKNQIRALLDFEEARREETRAYLKWERNRTFDEDGKAMVDAESLGQIENALVTSKDIFNDLQVPTNLTPVDTYFYARDIDKARSNMLPGIINRQVVLERVKSAIHSFLVTTEAEIEQGLQESPLFLRSQEYINAALARYAPSALEMFLAAQDRLYDGKPEDLAHALTSCRRMLKSLADALYPATGETIAGNDGVPRKMSDDAYRNRLVQYVREKLGQHKQGAVIQKTLDSLGGRLQSLDALASKGVHDTVSVAEAESCVVWTYLLAGDIVRIADGSSALLHTDAESPAK